MRGTFLPTTPVVLAPPCFFTLLSFICVSPSFFVFQDWCRDWCVPEPSVPATPLTHTNAFLHLFQYQVLGSGYLVLEILLPLLLIGLLAGSILPPLLRIVWSILLMGLAVIYRVVDYLADDILEPLLKAIFTRD